MSAFDNPTFVAMPSDPSIPLTPEQLNALFPGDVRVFIAMVNAGNSAGAESLVHEEVIPVA
jgi:hypothetical protein